MIQVFYALGMYSKQSLQAIVNGQYREVAEDYFKDSQNPRNIYKVTIEKIERPQIEEKP